MVIKEASRKKLGKILDRLNDWIHTFSLQLLVKAKVASLSGIAEFYNLQRTATGSARPDFSWYWVGEAEKMKFTSETGNFGRLLQLIRYASNGCCEPSFTLRDTEGQLESEKHRKIERWMGHFGQPLNRTTILPFSVRSQKSDISWQSPSIMEIADVVDYLKNMNPTGENRIRPEICKTRSKHLINRLHELLLSIWEGEVCPSDRPPITEIGDGTASGNYRCIILSDAAGKILCNYFLIAYVASRDRRTRPNQGGARSARSCVD